MSKYVVVVSTTEYNADDRTLDTKTRSVGAAKSITEAIHMAEDDLSDIALETADALYEDATEEEKQDWIAGYVSDISIEPDADLDTAQIGDQCTIIKHKAMSDYWVDINVYSIIKIG